MFAIRKVRMSQKAKFYKALASFMQKKGANPRQIRSRIKQISPWIAKAVSYRKRIHKQKKIKMSVDAYVNRYVYLYWAKKTGFASEYRKELRAK